MTIANQKNTIEKVPLFIFIATFAVGLLILFFSVTSQSLIPGIFEGEPYPSEPSYSDCNHDGDCSSGEICHNGTCYDPQFDPWCNPPDDDDDDDEPSPSPSNEPSPSPSPSESPSPPPSNFQCTGLGPQPDNPQRGDIFTFTCTSSVTDTAINHYNFRVNGAGDQKVDTDAGQATYNFTVPETGTEFNVQCQVCTSTDETNCTAWGQAH